MTHKADKTGFTLIEMLVAVTMIVTIVSMVYGSYSATSKSAEAYKARMTLADRTRSVLQQMARQIRCCYGGAPADSTGPTKAALPKTTAIPHGAWGLQSPVNYFKGGPSAPNGEILHLVTTSALSGEPPGGGLFDAAYRFDKSTHTLFVSCTRFVQTPKGLVDERDWSPLIENVEHIELTFFDGRQWLGEWDFTRTKNLPAAVRIDIACRDENRRQCSYGTVAHICCFNTRNNKTPSEMTGLADE
jgi:prepilin-type N-terminal cleavage/methylation domain-containing protein